MNDFKVLLQAVLDSSGIGKSDIAEVQKVLNKYHLNLAADLNKAELIKTVKQIVPELEAELKKITGIDIKINEADLLKAINQVEKDSIKAAKAATNAAKEAEKAAQQAAKEEEKLAESMEKVRAKSELAAKAEEKRQQLAQDKASNRALEEEYALREKIALQSKEIQLSTGDNGNTTTQIQSLSNSFFKLGLSGDEVKQKMSAVNAEFAQLKSVMASGDNAAIVNQFSKLNAVIGETNNDLKTLRSEQSLLASESRKLSSANSMATWLENNSKASKLFGADIKQWINTLRSADDLTVPELQKIEVAFKKIQISSRDMGLLGKTWGDSLKSNVSNFTSWLLPSGGIMAGLNGLRKMKDASIDLNGAITDLAMATGASKDQLQTYVESYSKLGDELSATVTDVTIAGTEYLKQGKSIAESQKLVYNTMVLDKIGKLGAAESTKYLTSAMKGYKVEVDDTMSIVDKLSAVDMASATDVGGLAEGMSQVAASADLAGVSMDKLLGYLATVGEVTQAGMSNVGTSFNAIFSRMGNIKLSRLKDYQNSGEDISNVETVLRGEGIALRDSTNSFRNFGDVLDEVSGKWTSFSELSQRAIASAFAGTHHMNDFIILMENYSTALQYTETSLNSSGEAMKKFSAYQDSVAAHTEKFKNSFVGLSDSLIDSGAINFFIDFGTALTKTGTGIVNFLTPLGLLGAGVGALASRQFSLKGLDYRINDTTQILHGSGKSYCYG